MNSFVSRSFVSLSKEELATKRRIIANNSRPTNMGDASHILGECGDLYITGSPSSIMHKNGAVIVPKAPYLTRFYVDNHESAVEIAKMYMEPRSEWSPAYVLKESFVINAWFLPAFGGWNFTSTKAFNAWSCYTKAGCALRSEGADFDEALSFTRFGSSDGLVEANVLNPEYVYSFEVTTSNDSKIAAKQRPDVRICRVINRQTGDLIPLSMFDNLPIPFLEPIDDSDENVMKAVANLEAPFENCIGVSYINARTGDRIEFTSGTYHSIYNSIMNGVNLEQIWTSSSPALRKSLEMIYDDRKEDFLKYRDGLKELAIWIWHYNNNMEMPKFKTRTPSKQMVSLAWSYKRYSLQEVANLLMGSSSIVGIKPILKTLRHWNKTAATANQSC